MLKSFVWNFGAFFVASILWHFIAVVSGLSHVGGWYSHVLLSLSLAGLWTLIGIRRECKKRKRQQSVFERLILFTIGALYPDCSSSQVQRYLEAAKWAELSAGNECL